jgi:hypothetical protein
MAFEEDKVSLQIGDAFIPIVENYTVRCGVLEVPATFEIACGHGGIFADLAARFKPRTPYKLFVNGKQAQEGENDGRGLGQGATIQLRGRDLLNRLDSQIVDERAYIEKSFIALTRTMLKEVGLGDREIVSTNRANRIAITGRDAKELEKKKVVDVTEVGTFGSEGAKIIEVHHTVKGEVGRTRWEILLEEFRRAGLFLWAGHDGIFILAQPNGSQAPMNRIVRRRGTSRNEVSVEREPEWHDDTTRRYTECIVVGRAGGGRKGRSQILGRFIDEEMVAYWNPDPADRKDGGKLKKPLVLRDHHVQTPEQANFLARRKIAESRRNGWRLVYTVPGHSAPSIGGGRGIWMPDTVHEVIDDELGIEGPMYCESVTFSAGGKEGTITKLHMMRIDDLVFAEDIPGRPKPKLKKRIGVTTVDRVVSPATPGGPVIWFRDPNVSIGEEFVVDAPVATLPKPTVKP